MKPLTAMSARLLSMRGGVPVIPLLAAMLTGLPSAAFAQSLPQYRVMADVRTADGGPPGAGDMVRVRLDYLDPATATPVSGPVRPIAFLRTVREGGGDCATAVRAYSLNKGMFHNASSLTGTLIATANSDGTIGFVDPLSAIATANIFELVQLPETASAIVPFAGEVAALMPRKGAVVMVDASGAVRTLADGLDSLSGIGVSGPVLYVSSGQSVLVFDQGGTLLFRHEAVASIKTVVALDNAHGVTLAPADIVVVDEAGGITILDSLDGRLRPAGQRSGEVVHAAGNRTALMTAGTSSAIDILYLDGGRGSSLDLGFTPAGLAADGLGLFGFAWSESGGKVAVIDMVKGRIADRFSLNAKPHEVLFSGRSLFVNHAGAAELTLIDTGPLTGGRGSVAVRTYEIETREAGPTPMAVHDPDKGWIIALPRGLSAANVYGNGNPTAPMTTTPLRSAPPLAVGTINRFFRETGPGRYEALGRFPQTGPVQLVTVTDDYSTIKCFDIESTVPVPPPEPKLMVAMDPPPIAGRPFVARLSVVGADDFQDRAGLRLAVSDRFGNVKQVLARRQDDGTFAFMMTIGKPGEYPVTAAAEGIMRPALIVVGDSP